MTQRRSLYLVLLIVGLGFALRSYQLDARPFWFDEGISVDLAKAPPGYVLETIDRPPAYYLLLHAWVIAAGVSPFALRFFSAWWSTLALVFFYLLARQLVDRRLSLWALLLAALAPFYIYYAQEARTYSLTFTFALMSCWALLVWLKTERPRYLILNAVATLICLYTHYSLLLLPVAQSVFVLIVTWHDLQSPGRYVPISTTTELGLYFLPLPHRFPLRFTQLKRPIQWIVTEVIVGLLFLPWPVYAQHGLPELIAPHIQSALSPAWLSGAFFVWKTLLEFSAGQALAWPLGEVIALVLVFLIGLGLFSPELSRRSRIFLALWLLLPPMMMLPLPRTSIYYEPKYLMMMTPAVYLLAIVGVAWIWQARLHIFNRHFAITVGATLAVGVLLLFGRVASLPLPEVPEPAPAVAEITPDIATSTPFNPTPYPTPIPFFNTTPVPNGQFVRSFWSDTANNYRFSKLYGISVSDEGSLLSYIHPISSTGSKIEIAPDGRIYLWNQRLEIYDPAYDAVERVSLPYPDPSWITSLTVAPDARVYGVATYGDYKDRHDQLFVYDPDTHAINDLKVVSPTLYLIAGANGHIYGFLGNNPGGHTQLKPPFDYDPVSEEMEILDMPIRPGEELVSVTPILGEDGYIYGVATNHIAPNQSEDFIFALNVTSGAVITDRITSQAWVNAIAPRLGGGVYLGTARGLWTLDPIQRKLAALPMPAGYESLNISKLATRSNGQLYGIGWQPGTESYLFSFNPFTRQMKWLEDIRGYYDPTYGMMRSDANDRAYLTFGFKAYSFEPDQHVLTGTVQSQSIAPLAVVLTRTYVSQQYASVEGLTCGIDGKLYGVKSTSANEDWLFWYDPKVPGQVKQVAPDIAREDQQPFTGGSTLLALPDGRLVGGTRNGHLFVYTPATHATLDLGRPIISSTNQIAALALEPDGPVYGGTTSYEASRLFAFDPATHVITDITLPVTQTHTIEALAVAHGRLYAGIGNQLIAYDPATQQTSLFGAPQNCVFHTLIAGPDGRIYAGCDNQLLAYRPQTAQVTLIGKTIAAEIRSLIVGDDGRIYGSYFRDYGGRCMSNCIQSNVFVYDPITNWMMDLGMAVSTGPAVLAACGDGTIYGGNNMTNSNYRGPAYLFAFRTSCPTGPVGTWDRLTWDADTPPNTTLTIDVLDGLNKPLMIDVPNGSSLQAINPISNTAISLRASLSTTDPRVTPILKNWRVDYTFACTSQPVSRQQ